MRKAAIAAFLLFLVSGLASASEGPDLGSWHNLKQVRPGEAIEVVDKNLRSLHGAFVSVSGEAIWLQDSKGKQSVARADVMRVSLRGPLHPRRDRLLGMLRIRVGSRPRLAPGPQQLMRVYTAPAAGALHPSAPSRWPWLERVLGSRAGSLAGARTIYRAEKVKCCAASH